MEQELLQQLAERLNITSLPEDEKQQLLDSVVEAIIQEVIIIASENLPEEKQVSLLAHLDSEKEGEDLEALKEYFNLTVNGSKIIDIAIDNVVKAIEE